MIKIISLNFRNSTKTFPLFAHKTPKLRGVYILNNDKKMKSWLLRLIESYCKFTTCNQIIFGILLNTMWIVFLKYPVIISQVVFGELYRVG